MEIFPLYTKSLIITGKFEAQNCLRIASRPISSCKKVWISFKMVDKMKLLQQFHRRCFHCSDT